ncbi:MAG: hypothetical protein IMX00_10470 [Limnochordales bacterium]|nr:hypothetical protein [Limnochordales bacterium]
MRSVRSCPRPEQQSGLLWKEVAQQVCELRDALRTNDQSRLQSLLASLPSLVSQLEAMAAQPGGLSFAGDEVAQLRAIRNDLATCRQLIADRLTVVRWELRLLGSLLRPAVLKTQPSTASPVCQLDLRV